MSAFRLSGVCIVCLVSNFDSVERQIKRGRPCALRSFDINAVGFRMKQLTFLHFFRGVQLYDRTV